MFFTTSKTGKTKYVNITLFGESFKVSSQKQAKRLETYAFPTELEVTYEKPLKANYFLLVIGGESFGRMTKCNILKLSELNKQHEYILSGQSTRNQLRTSGLRHSVCTVFQDEQGASSGDREYQADFYPTRPLYQTQQVSVQDRVSKLSPLVLQQPNMDAFDHLEAALARATEEYSKARTPFERQLWYCVGQIICLDAGIRVLQADQQRVRELIIRQGERAREQCQEITREQQEITREQQEIERTRRKQQRTMETLRRRKESRARRASDVNSNGKAA